MAMEGGTAKAVRIGKSVRALTLKRESGVVRLVSELGYAAEKNL